MCDEHIHLLIYRLSHLREQTFYSFVGRNRKRRFT
jgi:hypothetical protein